MAITASGLFGLTLEKMQIDTLGLSVESETTIDVAMITDSATPNFDTHDFWNDLEANEVSGTGYSAGGVALTGTEVTITGGTTVFDATDSQWATSTISNAMAAVGYFDRGGATTADELLFLSDFVTAASSSGGTFLISWHSSGIYIVDHTP